MAALNGDRLVARRYRNRRIGDFLKELDLTEGRCTGIPTRRSAMAENGSPPPEFATDEARTYFFVELLVHPELPGIAKSHVKAHDEAHVKTVWNMNPTERTILKFLENAPQPRPAIALLLGLTSRSGHLYKAIFRLRDVGYMRCVKQKDSCLRLRKHEVMELVFPVCRRMCDVVDVSGDIGNGAASATVTSGSPERGGVSGR